MKKCGFHHRCWYLQELIRLNRIEVIKYVINGSNNLDINGKIIFGNRMDNCNINYDDYSLLGFACNESGFDMIKLLINAGCDVQLYHNQRIINYIFERNKTLNDNDMYLCALYLINLKCKVTYDSIYSVISYQNNRKYNRFECCKILHKHGAKIEDTYVPICIDRGYIKIACWFIKCCHVKINNNMLRYIKTRNGLQWILNNYGSFIDINYNSIHHGTALFYHTKQGIIYIKIY